MLDATSSPYPRSTRSAGSTLSRPRLNARAGPPPATPGRGPRSARQMRDGDRATCRRERYGAVPDSPFSLDALALGTRSVHASKRRFYRSELTLSIVHSHATDQAEIVIVGPITEMLSFSVHRGRRERSSTGPDLSFQTSQQASRRTRFCRMIWRGTHS